MAGRRGYRRRGGLNLSAPRVVTFVIAAIVAFLALIIAVKLINNPFPSIAVVWYALVAYAILAIGNLVDGI